MLQFKPSLRGRIQSKLPVQLSQFVDIPCQTLADKVDEVKGRGRYISLEDARPLVLSNFERHKYVAGRSRRARCKNFTRSSCVRIFSVWYVPIMS